MMIKKKKLLIASQTQYGYLIDYVQYCRHLKDEFEITFICWDYNKPKTEEPEIDIIYISRKGNLITRNARFIKTLLKYLKLGDYVLSFIGYFRGASLISLLKKRGQKLHLDIRTGCVSENDLSRTFQNFLLMIESYFYKSTSIISEGLRQKLGISKKSYILPLGADPVYVTRESTHKIHLLYVGTLTNRRIEDTIEGFSFFLKQHPQANIFYTIVGDGWYNEDINIQKKIIDLGLQDHIYMTGYVSHNKLKQFYEKANAGISYIPVKSYYEFQPATKTFEYLMAGMPVIATNTYENKQIINKSNGILIDDNALSFSEGLANIYNHINSFDENEIRKTVQNNEWKKIIQTMKDSILP